MNPVKMPEAVALIGAAIALFLALLIVGTEDYKEAAREQIAYCENVRAGLWPDYDKAFEKECTAEKMKELENILP